MVKHTLVATCILVLSGGLLSSAASAADGPEASQFAFDKDVTPLLQKYCYQCHGNGKAKSDLALDSFKTLADVQKSKDKWELVLQNVRAREMPPEDAAAQPTQAERDVIIGWIEKELFKVDAKNPDPGQVTIRRLNRAEYNNTIRDLIGVDYQAAEDFPSDDSGYGFDNNGDVLSLPPVLMEKYLAAATRVLDDAIVTEPIPSKLRHFNANLMEMGFLAIAPNQKFLYAGVKIDQKPGEAAVQGYSIDAKTGRLTAINQQPSGGEEACFVSLDPWGKNVMAAHFRAATVSVLPVAADGRLSPPTVIIKQTGSSSDPRQGSALAHAIITDPAGKFALSSDLGADKIFIYRFDADKGMLTANDPPSVSVPPGSGARHLTFHPNGKWVYLLNELNGTVIGYNYDASRGALKQMDLIRTLPDDFKGQNTSAEVQIDPAGRFLYASNRIGTNFLTIFSIDQTSGKLTLVGYQDTLGKVPRNFRIDPTGKYLLVANQLSNSIVLFSIEKASGKLTAVGTPMEVRAPICVKFVAVNGE